MFNTIIGFAPILYREGNTGMYYWKEIYRGYKLSATYSNILSLAIDNAFHDSQKVVTTLLISVCTDWLHKT